MDRQQGAGVPLGELLLDLGGEAFGDWSSATVTGVTIDSRRVAPGDLFAALPGARVDGSRFTGEAADRGAVAVVLPRGVGTPPGLPGLRVPDPRRCLATIAARFHGRPSLSLRVHGVTGTNGKTTVASMTAQILATAGRSVGYWTTDEVETRGRRFRPVLTTPEANDLQRFLREVLDARGGDACIEVSSHAVVQHRVAEVRFASGVVTNVTGDHLDFHGDFQHYLEAKRGFVRSLAPPAVCLYNADDPGACAAVRGAGVETVSFGFEPGADLLAADPVPAMTGAACTVRVAPALASRLGIEPSFPLAVPVAGRHNLQNALAAAGVALFQGVAPATVQRALRSFRAAARRLCTRTVGPYAVVDDVAMNQGSYEAVFETLASAGHRALVVVNALRGNRGREVNAGIAATLARWDRRLHFAPAVVSLSGGAVRRYRADYRVRPEEVEAFAAAARDAHLAFTLHQELDDAVAEGVSRLRPGDALVLLGTFGMDAGPALAVARLRELTGCEPSLPAPLPPEQTAEG